jgi:hypothetical protein
MPQALAAIWNSSSPDASKRLIACVEKAAASIQKPVRTAVFFRADDIAVPSENFSRLISLFIKYGTPLALATIPARLTKDRWKQAMTLASADPSLWCWHQHGWRHENHSREGKKFEFGQERPYADMERDIAKGMNRLREIMGDMFCPVFTPPWNRCGRNALEILQRLGFKAVSRSEGRKNPAPCGLLEWNVNVDLHTRREKDPREGWNNLFAELETGLGRDLCGVMIHHQLMNEAAFSFLERFLQTLADRPGLRAVRWSDLAENPTTTGEGNERGANRPWA